MNLIRAAAAAFVVSAAVSAVSAQTGAISIQVVDSDREPLPGATVTIHHPTGYVADAAALTNGDGLAEFPVLRATGTTSQGYVIQVAFTGLATLTLPDVKVRIGETTRQQIQMGEEVVEHVKVVAQGETIDLEDSTQSTRFSSEFMSDIPVPARFYQNMLTMSPGVLDADGDGNPTVHGSRDRDFRAEVGGVANVDPLTGQRMSEVVPSSIEEMKVITTGAGVEFGRAQGAFAQILQKTGSNEFEGAFELYWRSSLLDGDGADDHNNTRDPEFDDWQPAIQVSGPIVKDKMWYRLSHMMIDRGQPVNTTRGIAVVDFKQGVHADQITWQVSPRNQLAFQYQADPLTIDNFGVSSTLPSEASQRREFKSETYQLSWKSPYSPKILVESRAAWQDLNVVIGPSSRGLQNDCLTGPEFLENAQCFNLVTGSVSGSYPQDWDDHRQRLTVRGDATVFAGDFLGSSHQLKFGMGVENERFVRELDRRPTIAFFLLSPSDETNTGEGRPEQVGRIFGNFSAPESTQVTAKGIVFTLYAEDQLKPARNLTLTLGLRMDREEIGSDGSSQFDPEAESEAWNAAVQAGQAGAVVAQETFTKYEAQRDFFRQLAATMQVDFDELWKQQSVLVQDAAFWQHARRAENIGLANTNVAPRLSLAWDPWGNGKTKFAATAGRYYQAINLDIPLIELEPARTFIAFDTVQTGAGFVFDKVSSSVNPSLNINTVDRDLATPYSDEWTLQFEREIARETTLRVSYINRRYRDQLQDIDLNHVPGDFGRCNTQMSPAQPTIVAVQPGDPDYHAATGTGDGIVDDCIGELEFPGAQNDGGEGGQPTDAVILQRPDETADLYVQNPGWGGVFLVSNLNQIDYDGYVLELTRRQYRNWELIANYTWSRAFGDGEDFQQDLGNDRSLVDDEQGYQANDQRHVVRVTATTITPWGFRLGGSMSWQSGLPFSVVRRGLAYDAIPPAYQSLNPGSPARERTTYLTGQRNDQRNDSYWDFNLKATKELRLGRSVNMQVSVEVFNLFNDGTYIIYDDVNKVGEQVNGNNTAFTRFGRSWQLGMKLAF